MSFVLTDIESDVRLDLFDPAGGSQRWATTDIDRAIDKAIDKYSTVYPNVAYADMAMQPFQRTYPYPTSYNASYPVQWIERVLYPLQVYGSYYKPPSTAPTAAKTAGSGLASGTYKYLTTFISQGGETTIGPSVTVTTSAGQQQVNLSAIPVGPSSPTLPGISTSSVTGRNIYRTQVGGSTFTLLTTLGDNTTTTYTDSTADATIATMPAPPTLNTSGIFYWPPLERDFAEYSNLFDSNAALAAGGNAGAGGAVGTAASDLGSQAPTFTLILNTADLPQDSTLLMRVFYATKHQLDSSGTTIPEIHKDVINLGACAYAMEAYQVPTNDNFDFQDGGLRDRIDDTKIPTTWLAAAANKMQQFEERLEEIKRARDYASSARIRWGDVPRYWVRL